MFTRCITEFRLRLACGYELLARITNKAFYFMNHELVYSLLCKYSLVRNERKRDRKTENYESWKNTFLTPTLNAHEKLENKKNSKLRNSIKFSQNHFTLASCEIPINWKPNKLVKKKTFQQISIKKRSNFFFHQPPNFLSFRKTPFFSENSDFVEFNFKNDHKNFFVTSKIVEIFEKNCFFFFLIKNLTKLKFQKKLFFQKF